MGIFARDQRSCLSSIQMTSLSVGYFRRYSGFCKDVTSVFVCYTMVKQYRMTTLTNKEMNGASAGRFSDMDQDDTIHPATPSSSLYTATEAYSDTDDELSRVDLDEQVPSTSNTESGSLLKRRPELGLSSRRYSEHDCDARGQEDDMLGPSQVSIMQVSSKALEQCEDFVRRVWDAGWKVVHHNSLPKWLKDNDFLIKGHRPQLNSFRSCFKSVFRIHTETGNIWTHLLGFIAFVGVTFYFLSRPSVEIQWQEKAVFSAFFAGAILCLGFSTVFHTVYCHSERVGKLFNKLDYCGIALLTMGSFVPWLYYSFYCRLEPKIVYLVLIFTLGGAAIVVSLWDKFSEPRFRALRAGVFIALGLSGVIPAMHYVITDGFYEAVNFASLGWLVLMAVLYITGAVIYAARIPERIWPGKFDIWFQSHQIFHVFVVAAAFVHYHGIVEIANYRLTFGDCVAEE